MGAGKMISAFNDSRISPIMANLVFGRLYLKVPMLMQASASRMLEVERMDRRLQLSVSQDFLKLIETQSRRQPMLSGNEIQCLMLAREIVRLDEFRYLILQFQIKNMGFEGNSPSN